MIGTGNCTALATMLGGYLKLKKNDSIYIYS